MKAVVRTEVPDARQEQQRRRAVGDADQARAFSVQLGHSQIRP